MRIRSRANVVRTFQNSVKAWVIECFGPRIAQDHIERNHRFLEEALELVQANALTRAEAHELVDYVFNRPVGLISQEVGGTMVTLAALCSSIDLDMLHCGENELMRCWQHIEKIRTKQAAKPQGSPLPQAVMGA